VTTIKIFLPVGDKAIDIYKKKVEFEDIYRTSGVGKPSNKNKGTNLGKQEAFVAAFAFALGNCSDLLPFSKIDNLMYQFANLKTGDLVYHSNYFNYIFDMKKGAVIQKSYLFRFVYYKNKMIFKFIEPFMKSPEITPGKFPSWHDLPFSISGIKIVDVTFSSDSDDIISIPKGGAKVSIEVPITTLELIKYQKQDWKQVYKNDSFKDMMIWKELEKELDQLDFTNEGDNAKRSNPK